MAFLLPIRNVMRLTAAMLMGTVSSFAGSAAALWNAKQTRFCIDYSETPDMAVLREYDVCILAAEAKVDVEALSGTGIEQGRGRRVVLGYASLVEVRPGTKEAEAAERRGIPTVSRNAAWNTAILDITHPAWSAWVLEDLVGPALAKGFDGVFLDTIDSAVHIAPGKSAKADASHAALVKIIHQMRKRHPETKIIINRGFALVPEVAKQIDGMLIESLLQTWDGAQKTYAAVKKSDTEWLMRPVVQCQQHGLPVFIVDYMAAGDHALAESTAKRIAQLGCIPFVSTPDLQGIPHPLHPRTDGNTPGK